MKLSFVIPCYRSEKTIAGVIEEITNTVALNQDVTYEIILVNDHSPDGVLAVLRNKCTSNPNIKVLDLTKNFGQHAALLAGYAEAAGDLIISLDDDGQTPANEVFKLIEKLNEGYDVVFASYEQKKHAWYRNFGSRVNNLMANLLIGKPKNLGLSSYFVAKSFIIKEIVRYDNPYPYISGLLLRSTSEIANVPVNHRKRSDGHSGYSARKLLSLWFNGFTAFSVKPLRVSTFTGGILATVGFLYAIYIIINKINNPAVPLGWSSSMASLMFIGGIIMLMLGLIGEYIGRIYISINRSPQYVIREKINIQDGE